MVGEDTTLGSDRLRTLLLIVMRNATTDSPWPLSNNPLAMYNLAKRKRPGQGSKPRPPVMATRSREHSRPTYFPPETIDAGGPVPFLMVDGGVTMYNNPAFLVFLWPPAGPTTSTGRRARKE